VPVTDEQPRVAVDDEEVLVLAAMDVDGRGRAPVRLPEPDPDATVGVRAGELDGHLAAVPPEPAGGGRDVSRCGERCGGHSSFGRHRRPPLIE
jgi:hypothetical protein